MVFEVHARCTLTVSRTQLETPEKARAPIGQLNHVTIRKALRDPKHASK